MGSEGSGSGGDGAGEARGRLACHSPPPAVGVCTPALHSALPPQMRALIPGERGGAAVGPWLWPPPHQPQRASSGPVPGGRWYTMCTAALGAPRSPRPCQAFTVVCSVCLNLCTGFRGPQRHLCWGPAFPWRCLPTDFRLVFSSTLFLSSVQDKSISSL